MLTASATTIIAVRDTELAKIPAEVINFVKLHYPQVLLTQCDRRLTR